MSWRSVVIKDFPWVVLSDVSDWNQWNMWNTWKSGGWNYYHSGISIESKWQKTCRIHNLRSARQFSNTALESGWQQRLRSMRQLWGHQSAEPSHIDPCHLGMAQSGVAVHPAFWLSKWFQFPYQKRHWDDGYWLKGIFPNLTNSSGEWSAIYPEILY